LQKLISYYTTHDTLKEQKTMQLPGWLLFFAAAVQKEEVLQLSIAPFSSPTPDLAPFVCPSCTVIGGTTCVPTKRFVLRFAFDGHAVTQLLTTSQLDTLRQLRWKLMIVDERDPDVYIMPVTDVPVTESHDLNFGVGIPEERVFVARGELFLPANNPGERSFVFTGSTRFCVSISRPVTLAVGTDACHTPESGLISTDETGARFISPAPNDAPWTMMPPELCYWYTQGGRIPVSRLYFDDKSDPGHSYQPRSREYIDKLVQRARSREVYYYNRTDTWMYEAMDTHSIQGLGECDPKE
jgi:hypothetical protein